MAVKSLDDTQGVCRDMNCSSAQICGQKSRAYREISTDAGWRGTNVHHKFTTSASVLVSVTGQQMIKLCGDARLHQSLLSTDTAGIPQWNKVYSEESELLIGLQCADTVCHQWQMLGVPVEWPVHRALRWVSLWEACLEFRRSCYRFFSVIKISYLNFSELTSQPEMEKFELNDIAGKKGSRLVSLTWKVTNRNTKVNVSSLLLYIMLLQQNDFIYQFPAQEMPDSYYVTVVKASGEISELMRTSQPQIRLILSYSAFNFSIRAVNNASTSPAVNRTIAQQEDTPSENSYQY